MLDLKNNKHPHSYIIAGTHSGVGKTTVTFALMSLLSKEGFRVQPFKIGPDFIDPAYHFLATKKKSINLDLYMMGWESIKKSYDFYSKNADIVIIESMGAMHDGENGTDKGSCADFSKKLSIPVILTVDIWGMTRSAEALISGFESFDPDVEIVGIVLNRAGSKKHFDMVFHALSKKNQNKIIGYILNKKNIFVEERHLGLKTVHEISKKEFKENLINETKETLDIKKFFKNLKKEHVWGRKGKNISRHNWMLGEKYFFNQRKKWLFRKQSHYYSIVKKKTIPIGVPRDKAFCFYYEENLRLLEEAGARLVFFSPIFDKKIPKNVYGVYMGGGYPEIFAEAISSNFSIKEDFQNFAKRGHPIYAECGGLIFLSKHLIDDQDQIYEMANIFPFEIKMDPSYLAIRYVELELQKDCCLGKTGIRLKGQEFHQSRIINPVNINSCYKLIHSSDHQFSGGFSYENIICSYAHLHFSSHKNVPKNFLKSCTF